MPQRRAFSKPRSSWSLARVVTDRLVKPGDPTKKSEGLLFLHHGDVGGVFVLHADDVVASIDMEDLAGDAAPEIGQEIKRASADVLDRHRAPERRVGLAPFEDDTGASDDGVLD